MDVGALIIILFTVVIHLLGIGLFLLWLILGKPTSKQGIKDAWSKFKILPW